MMLRKSKIQQPVIVEIKKEASLLRKPPKQTNLKDENLEMELEELERKISELEARLGETQELEYLQTLFIEKEKLEKQWEELYEQLMNKGGKLKNGIKLYP